MTEWDASRKKKKKILKYAREPHVYIVLRQVERQKEKVFVLPLGARSILSILNILSNKKKKEKAITRADDSLSPFTTGNVHVYADV